MVRVKVIETCGDCEHCESYNSLMDNWPDEVSCYRLADTTVNRTKEPPAKCPLPEIRPHILRKEMTK